ncbi:acylphosphatase [Patescibacteria group bacterium]
MIKRAKIIVSGRVQGVNLRISTANKAKILGLLGFIRNLANGTVEIVVEGEEANIESFRKWLQTSTGSTQVSDVRLDYSIPTNEYNDFEIQYN